MKERELCGHHTHSEETKRKIGEATARIHTELKRTDYTKEKIRQKALGRIVSKETIQKRINTINKNGGFICSNETRAKISKSNSGRKFSKEHRDKLSSSKRKKIYTYNIETNEYAETSIKDFSNLLGIYPSCITDRLNRYMDRIYRNKYFV